MVTTVPWRWSAGTCPCVGATCEDVLAPCAGGPCKNGGECRESEDYKRFSCSCPPGWQGEPALPSGSGAQQPALVFLPVPPSSRGSHPAVPQVRHVRLTSMSV